MILPCLWLLHRPGWLGRWDEMATFTHARSRWGMAAKVSCLISWYGCRHKDSDQGSRRYIHVARGAICSYATKLGTGEKQRSETSQGGIAASTTIPRDWPTSDKRAVTHVLGRSCILVRGNMSLEVAEGGSKLNRVRGSCSSTLQSVSEKPKPQGNSRILISAPRKDPMSRFCSWRVSGTRLSRIREQAFSQPR